MPRLLVIEDDATMRSALVRTLTAAGYEVESAENGHRALEKAAHQPLDLIVSDIRMPGMDGVLTVSRLKESLPGIKTILITGYSDDEPIVRALNVGVDGILKKPFALKELLRIVSLKLEEKQKEDAQAGRERIYRRLLSKMRENLGDEKFKEVSGADFPLPPDAGPDHLERLAVLVEIGRMAEIRQEFDVAIQAYEQGLDFLSDRVRSQEEFPLRLGLSNLFAKKGDLELALFHAETALNSAEELCQKDLIIEAHHHLGKILLVVQKDGSRQHLNEAKRQLESLPLGKSHAVSSLMFCALWFGMGELGKAKEAALEFLSLGKRSFLPQVLISLQDVALAPLLLSLGEDLGGANVSWILEEAGPFVQDKLRYVSKTSPSLGAALNSLVPGNRKIGQSMMEVFGLGKLLMFVEGYSLLETHWKSLKGRSVLLFLAHEHPKLVSEERVLDTFWPSLDGEKGRHAFRTTLYLLRRTLGLKLSNEILHIEKQKYGLRPGSMLNCDFLRFRDFYNRAKAVWERGDHDHAALFLKEAEILYKGDFLQGWSEEWVLAAREQFRETYTWILLALAAYHRKQRSWREVLAYAKKAIAMDPTLEEAHSLTMECFLEVGKRDEAVKQFHACKDILKNELDLPPSENVRELYMRAIDARPAVGVGA